MMQITGRTGRTYVVNCEVMASDIYSNVGLYNSRGDLALSEAGRHLGAHLVLG